MITRSDVRLWIVQSGRITLVDSYDSVAKALAVGGRLRAGIGCSPFIATARSGGCGGAECPIRFDALAQQTLRSRNRVRREREAVRA